MSGLAQAEKAEALQAQLSDRARQCTELELRLLGRLLSGAPGALQWLPDIQESATHFDVLNYRILEKIAAAPRIGVKAVTPSSIALAMADDPELTKLGGRDYLVEVARWTPAEATQDQVREGIAVDLALHQKHIAHIKLADCVDAAHQAFAAGSPDAISYLSEIPDLIAKADQTQRSLAASPYAWTEPEALPTREWLYGHHLIRKFASATIAAGGIGKSSLSIAEAIALASGKPVLGVRTALPRRVWLWNLEDPSDEIARRVQAVCLHYRIARSEIEGRLFVSSGRDDPCVIARTDRAGTFIAQPLVDRIVAEIKAKRIDVLVIDPFVACHAVAENDNGAIEAVAKEWARVADRASCAVELVHHSRKTGGAEVTADDARGASALVNACRSVRTLNRMTVEEAAKAGVEAHRRYFRVLTDKLNLAPPPETSDWFMLESISLGNGPPSDHVGVVVPWQWPDAFDGIQPGMLFAVQQRIAKGSWKESPQAKNWAGVAIAEALEIDLDDPKEKNRCRKLLSTWVSGGALKVVRKLDESRHERPFIEVGQWAA